MPNAAKTKTTKTAATIAARLPARGDDIQRGMPAFEGHDQAPCPGPHASSLLSRTAPRAPEVHQDRATRIAPEPIGAPIPIGEIVARMFSSPAELIRGGDLGDGIPAPGNDAPGGEDAAAVQAGTQPASV